MQTNRNGFRNSDSLTRWVRYLLCAQMLVAIVSLYSNYLEYQLLTDYQNGVYISQEQAVADGEVNDQRQVIIALVYFVVFVISGFLILRWIHRANFNARQLGAENMKFSPGWSIGFYFVPILALWKPYQAMKEIWQASKNPSEWDSQTVSSLLPLWWTLWLCSNLLGQAVYRMSRDAEELNEFILANMTSQVSALLDIPLALVFMAVVKSIHHMQTTQQAKANAQTQPGTKSDDGLEAKL